MIFFRRGVMEQEKAVPQKCPFCGQESCGRSRCPVCAMRLVRPDAHKSCPLCGCRFEEPGKVCPACAQGAA